MQEFDRYFYVTKVGHAEAGGWGDDQAVARKLELTETRRAFLADILTGCAIGKENRM
jgi:hypothetical protein